MNNVFSCQSPRCVNEPERTGTAFRLDFVQPEREGERRGGEGKEAAFRLQTFSIYTPAFAA
jgi:hypothetical protein